MARDTTIESIFTTADDAMQGLWGLHVFTKAALDVADRHELIGKLPQSMFMLTHEWPRVYDPSDLIRQMDDAGVEFLHSRASLVSLVAVFEAAARRFNERLAQLGKSATQSGYKNLLKWVFSTVRSSSSGSEGMITRLPETCGDVDNARRLRNCIVHSNGKYDPMYLSDVIQDQCVKVQFEKDHQTSVRETSPIFLTSERFEHYSRSHIELLHILHNTIQKEYFDHVPGYNYAEEGKKIEWHRILSGRKDVRM